MEPDLSVYLVTDAALARRNAHHLPDLVAAAVRGGVTTVQVREKDVNAARFLHTVQEIGELIPESVTLLVNDRVDIYLAARELGVPVDGVHVGQDDLPIEQVRRLIGDDAVLGLSAATDEELRVAGASPARVDYVGVGVLRGTATKPDAPRPLGLSGMARSAAATALPVVAIGGVTLADIAELRSVGVAGVAVVSTICAALDPEAAARAVATRWKDAA